MKKQWNHRQIAEANQRAYEKYSQADYTPNNAEHQLQLYRKALNRIYKAVKDYRYFEDETASKLFGEAREKGAAKAKEDILNIIKAEAKLINERR